MTIQVNAAIINAIGDFPLDSTYASVMPTLASVSCLSDADSAPWTNRVPTHEPWPRTMSQNTTTNAVSDQCDYNTAHEPQFVDDGGGIGSYSINRVEGEDTITRNQFWRR